MKFTVIPSNPGYLAFNSDVGYAVICPKYGDGSIIGLFGMHYNAVEFVQNHCKNSSSRSESDYEIMHVSFKMVSE